MGYDNFKHRLANLIHEAGARWSLSRDPSAIRRSAPKRSFEPIPPRIQHLLWRQDQIAEQLENAGVDSPRSAPERVKGSKRRDALRAEWQTLEKEIMRLANQNEDEGHP